LRGGSKAQENVIILWDHGRTPGCATGTVKEVDQVPRIEIDDAKQIRIAVGT
jgi:hypothetical protein